MPMFEYSCKSCGKEFEALVAEDHAGALVPGVQER